MSVAQLLALLESLPADFQTWFNKLNPEIQAAIAAVAPDEQFLLDFFPAVRTALDKAVAEVEAVVAAEVAKLPANVQAIVNQYVLAIEGDLKPLE
jgi:hypothetical protein